MEMICFFECKDLAEAKQKEQEYYISLNATLNSIEPCPRQKIKSVKHIIKTPNVLVDTPNVLVDTPNVLVDTPNVLVDMQTSVISESRFYCEKCVYKTEYRRDWKKHISSIKHNTLVKVIPTHICSGCLKKYKSNVGVWKHKKKCLLYKAKLDKSKEVNIICEKTIIENNERELIKKENEEIKKMILDIVKSNANLTQQIIDLRKK
jgi:hypothetical protein